MQKNEKERKELNKKLLKNTFKSEIRNRKKVKPLEYIIDFIGILIAFYLADLIVEILSINFWFLDMVITVVLIFVMISICSIIVRRIGKK
ncbi:hypothetical protein [Anaeromicropila herbilytica]|uniref:Uncharacterized protein n=1 Tax=Anaeromicropila herbilytica TaxID=2785025 RepID=A0A7R7ICL4_9FIRM|nr:hypothetical protein [Anaeromicropila herbilytica]BCN30873.1 hypothetical protein bsdtb5_21680 [Anaeromicropila herbilytica]